MLFSIIPIELIENAKIPHENIIKTLEQMISYGFWPTISPYPTVAIVVAAQ